MLETILRFLTTSKFGLILVAVGLIYYLDKRPKAYTKKEKQFKILIIVIILIIVVYVGRIK
jgi:hypothetical protein